MANQPDAGTFPTASRAATAAAVLLLFITGCQDAVEPPIATTLEAVTSPTMMGVAGAQSVTTPVVRVLDQWDEPLAGVAVMFSVVEGAGELERTSQSTRGDGTADAGAWTLGVVAGANRVRASVAGLIPVDFVVTGAPGPAARIAIVGGDGQAGVVGGRLPELLRVQVLDEHGNAVPGVVVTFVPELSGGATVSSLTSTDGRGLAEAAWTVGTRSGVQKLSARADGAGEVVFEALVAPGEPATLEVVEGQGQTAVVSSPLGDAPGVRVLDAWGNAVTGIPVRFEVVGGGGAIEVAGSAATEATVVSDDDGVARVEGWVLGPAAGLNVVRAVVGDATASIQATGIAGAAAALTLYRGDGQTAEAGKAVAVAPAVRVVDQLGNGVAGVEVHFAVDMGGGTITGAEAETDADGVAGVGAWTLGATGTNTLIGTSAGLGTAVFTATAAPAGSLGGGGGTGGGSGGSGGSSGGGYDLEVVFNGTVAASWQSEIYAAAGRWASVITGDLPDVVVNIPANACGMQHPAVSKTVDDLLVLVTITPIDGAGGILGSAGPCYVRSAGGLPIVGAVRIDEADMAYLENNGRLGDVLAHEFGHVVGIGTRWGTQLTGAGTTDPYFTGPTAISAFLGAGGSAYSGQPVPVENSGGAGTRDGHWRESVFNNELMTGWLDLGGNPLSGVTIGALEDIGYSVDFTYAEGFSLSPGAASIQEYNPTRPRIEVRESVLPIQPIAVDSRGRRAPLRPFRR